MGHVAVDNLSRFVDSANPIFSIAPVVKDAVITWSLYCKSVA
jgi:hypothetical protein